MARVKKPKTLYLVRDYVYDQNVADFKLFTSKAKAMDFAHERIQERLDTYNIDEQELKELIDEGVIEIDEGDEFCRAYEDTARVQVYEIEPDGDCITIYS